MVFRRKANQAAISNQRARKSIAETALWLMNDFVGTTGVSQLEQRLIYYAALLGTLEGHPPNITKLAETTKLSRQSIRRRIEGLLDGGMLLRLSDGTFAVRAEYANSEAVLARLGELSLRILKSAREISTDPDLAGRIGHHVTRHCA